MKQTPRPLVDHAQGEADEGAAIALPAHLAGSPTLDILADTVRDYARAPASDNTLKAYAKDWAHFSRWCRMKDADPLPPSPALPVSTTERRLSGLTWNDAQRGFNLDHKNRHIGTVMAGIKRRHARPPVQRGHPGNGRHPAPGPAWITRPRAAVDLICRKPAPVRGRRGGPCQAVLRPQPAHGAGQFGGGRQALHPEAAWPCVGGKQPPLPAPP